MLKFSLIIFLFLPFYSKANITLKKIEEYKITPKKVEYKIQAESKNINYKKLKKFQFYNKEKIASQSSFYLKGKFSTKLLNINFEKGYFLEGKFIMLNLVGSFNKTSFLAKKAIYSSDSLILKNTKVKKGKRKYKKYIYKIKL